MSYCPRTIDGGTTWTPVAAIPATANWSVDQVLAVPGGAWVLGRTPANNAQVAMYASRTGSVGGGFRLPGALLPSRFAFLSARVGFVMLDGMLLATADGGRTFGP